MAVIHDQFVGALTEALTRHNDVRDAWRHVVLAKVQDGIDWDAATAAINWVLVNRLGECLPYGSIIADRGRQVWVKDSDVASPNPWAAVHATGPFSNEQISTLLGDLSCGVSVVRVGTQKS